MTGTAVCSISTYATALHAAKLHGAFAVSAAARKLSRSRLPWSIPAICRACISCCTLCRSLTGSPAETLLPCCSPLVCLAVEAAEALLDWLLTLWSCLRTARCFLCSAQSCLSLSSSLAKPLLAGSSSSACCKSLAASEKCLSSCSTVKEAVSSRRRVFIALLCHKRLLIGTLPEAGDCGFGMRGAGNTSMTHLSCSRPSPQGFGTYGVRRSIVQELCKVQNLR